MNAQHSQLVTIGQMGCPSEPVSRSSNLKFSALRALAETVVLCSQSNWGLNLHVLNLFQLANWQGQTLSYASAEKSIRQPPRRKAQPRGSAAPCHVP